MRAMRTRSRGRPTFLFTVDAKTVIDAGVNGNEARFVNHGCDPNCQKRRHRTSEFSSKRFAPYGPARSSRMTTRSSATLMIPPNVDEVFACRCGARKCRGSMLEAASKVPRRKPKQRSKRLSTRPRSPAKPQAAAVNAERAMNVAADLGRRGMHVQDQYLHAARRSAHCANVRMRAARAGRLSRRHDRLPRAELRRDAQVRGDVTCWLQRAAVSRRAPIAGAAGGIAPAIEPRAFLGLFELELHYAWYPPGSGVRAACGSAARQHATRRCRWCCT